MNNRSDHRVRSPRKFEFHAETSNWLDIVESSNDDLARHQAIESLGKLPEAARVLLEAFDLCMWRTTKIAIIQALAKSKDERAFIFLTRLAKDANDLGLAAEAILSLGEGSEHRTGAFLRALILKEQFPLIREALISLAKINSFDSESLILSILKAKPESYPDSVIQCALIASGISGFAGLLPAVEKYLETPYSNNALLNSAIIASGRLGGLQTANKLRQLDIRYRFFANQLNSAALERINLRSKFSVEDAVQDLLQAKSMASQLEAHKRLKEFPAAVSREAFRILAPNDVAPDLNMLATTATLESRTLVSDFNHWSQKWEMITRDVAAAFITRGLALQKGGEIEDLLLNMLRDSTTDRMTLLQIFQHMIVPVKLRNEFSQLCLDESLDETVRLAAIGALSTQGLLSGFAGEILNEICQTLLSLVEKETRWEVVGRAIRQLGELGFSSPRFVTRLRALLKDEDHLAPSIFYALALNCEAEGSKLILRKLNTWCNKNSDEAETLQIMIGRGLRALSEVKTVANATDIFNLPKDILSKHATYILKILTNNHVPEAHEFIAPYLDSEVFGTKILAITATKLNPSDANWQKVVAILNHTNSCLRERAIDSLANGGHLKEHIALIKWMETRSHDRQIVQKILRSLSINSEESYTPIVDRLTLLIEKRQGAFDDDEVLVAAETLRDSLLLTINKSNSPISTKKSIKNSSLAHDIDRQLDQQVPGFSKYSETVKTVLRNAELTYSHSELFNEKVDKSTLIIQYVKSIDMLLQEKFGQAMFLSPGSGLNVKMQSRVLQLQLDDESLSAAHFVSSLQCGYHFSADDFPVHKMQTMARTIMNGRFFSDQYKVLDGLRAWAVLLLIYGRSFKFRSTTIEPLLPVKNSNNQVVSFVAAKLNQLQDVRNLAAHRGTLLEANQAHSVRERCFEIYSALQGLIFG